VEADESHLEAALREVTEESGYANLVVRANLGHQVVQFDHRGCRVLRDEYYFLLETQSLEQTDRDAKELQFVPDWVSWEQALSELSFAPEREWVRRARVAQERGQKRQGP
jgi:hypothetical protein